VSICADPWFHTLITSKVSTLEYRVAVIKQRLRARTDDKEVSGSQVDKRSKNPKT
jgi:hypothetical protein